LGFLVARFQRNAHALLALAALLLNVSGVRRLASGGLQVAMRRRCHLLLVNYVFRYKTSL